MVFIYDGNGVNQDIKKLGEIVDSVYWERRINDFLETNSYFSKEYIKVKDVEHCAINLYKFYLGDVTEISYQMFAEVSYYLPGCMLKHEKINYRDNTIKIEIPRYITWIEVGERAQKIVNTKNKFNVALTRIKAKVDKADIYFLFVCIVGLFFSLLLLGNHWKDYEEPWRNLVEMGQKMI